MAKKLLLTILEPSGAGGKKGLKSFDQWTEELSREIFIRNDEIEARILSRLNEMIDEDFEEE